MVGSALVFVFLGTGEIEDYNDPATMDQRKAERKKLKEEAKQKKAEEKRLKKEANKK